MEDTPGMGVFALQGEVHRLGPYQLLGQLATGGMGVVYLGRDPASREIAAVKTVLAPGGVSQEARRRFAREAELARRVHSRYTARILAADPGAERPWMAMEYVPAPSLEALVVREGPLGDEAAVRWIAAGLAQGLADLHDRRIVHRDVKPLNVLLTVDDPKIIDFGISHASDLTTTRLTIGTIAFAAPEQAEGLPSSPASDVYALGVTLYYLACGTLPYPPTQEPLQQLNFVRRGAGSLDALPGGLAEALRDCLALRPEERPTAQALVERFASPDRAVLPPGWASLIGRHAEEGRRLQLASDQAAAETVTRDWTGGVAGGGDGAGGRAPKKKPGKAGRAAEGKKPREGKKPDSRPAGYTPTEVDATASPGAGSPAAPKPKPAPRPKPKPAPEPPPPAAAAKKKQGSDSWVGIVVGLVLLIGGIWFVSSHAHHSGNSASGSSGASGTTTAPPSTDDFTDVTSGGTDGDDGGDDGGTDTGGDDGGDGDDGDTYTTDPPALSAEDEEFAAVSTGDCLDNYYEDSWTPDTPLTTSCSATAAYYEVDSVEDSRAACSDDDMPWFHSNDDDTDTVLCLTRNYVAGQCMYADAHGDSLSIHYQAISTCSSSIPDAYQYVVRVTSVSDGSEEGDCGEDRRWDLDDGTILCGRAVWKEHGLKDM